MKQQKNILSRLMKYAGNFKIAMVLSWVLSAAGGIIIIGTYICIYRVARSVLIDSGGVPGNELAELGWTALNLTMMSFAVYGGGLMLSHLAAFNTMSKLRIKLIRHLERVPLGYYSENTSGELRKIVEKGVESTENFIAHQMPDMVQSLIMPVAFLISMFYFDWRISLVCLIPVTIGFAALATMLKSESSEFIDKYQQALSEMSSAGVEYVRGISVVKVFGQTVHSFKQFYQAINAYKKFSVDYVMSMKQPMSIFITAVNGLFFVLIPVVIVLYNNARNPEKVLHSLIFFIVFIPLVAVLLMRVMNCSSNMMMATQALDSIEKILVVPERRVTANSVQTDDFGIEFQDVSFHYNQEAGAALDGLSFTATAGTITALVGPSGSGKSTVANLIAQFWDTYSGKILIGGRDIRDLDYRQWMRQCSFVFQDAGLLKMSITDNVAFCCEETSTEDVRRALHEAQCDDIIAKLPDGINTVVGTDGIYLSGGEQQRIALARAILQDAPVVLLDEATSFADPENEYLIQKALAVLLKKKTVLMIAHRLSTITDADNIIVLEAGRLVEQGTHFELLAQGQKYARMYQEYNASTAWKIGGIEHDQ